MTSTTPWANTIAAVTDVERAGARGQWRIGEAIAEDLAGAESAPRKVFAECAKILEAKGFPKYDASYLAKLHRTARIFSHNERHPDLAWDVHYEAGHPSNLQRAATALRKLNKSVTQFHVRWIMREWLSEATNGRREKHAAARVAKAAAKAKLKAATEKQLAANTQAEKEAAQKERQEAKREAAEADKQIIATAGAPRGNINAPLPKIHALEAAAMTLVAGARADKIKKLEKQALDELDQILDQIGIDTKQRLLENYTRVVDLAHEIVGRLAGHTHKFQILPQPAPPKPQDIGPYSRAETDRLRSRTDELGAEKRLLEIKITGLENENRELKARVSELENAGEPVAPIAVRPDARGEKN